MSHQEVCQEIFKTLGNILPQDLVHIVTSYETGRRLKQVKVSAQHKQFLYGFLALWALVAIPLFIVGFVFLFLACDTLVCIGGISEAQVIAHTVKDIICVSVNVKSEASCTFKAGINTTTGCEFWFGTFDVKNKTFSNAEPLWSMYPINSTITYDGRGFSRCPEVLTSEKERKSIICSFFLLPMGMMGCFLCCFVDWKKSNEDSYITLCCYASDQEAKEPLLSHDFPTSELDFLTV